MGSSHQTRVKSTEHTAMDASRVWYNVPITITRTNGETNSPKKVRWSDNLTQVKTISPRYKASPFSWPRQKSCNHLVCTPGEACKMISSYSYSRDPGLAFNNNNYWKPDKKELSLNLRNNYSYV